MVVTLGQDGFLSLEEVTDAMALSSPKRPRNEVLEEAARCEIVTANADHAVASFAELP